MRCFLAIELNKELREELIRIQNELEPFIDAKFVEPENLHLTLKFFPNVDEKDLKDMIKSLKDMHFSKFPVYLESIGFFPNESLIRIVWVGLRSERIKELHDLIESRLENFSKDNNFESHITLARVKKINNKEGFLKKIEKLKINALSFEVNEFFLKKSTLTDKGPIYGDVEKFKLV